MTNKTSRQVVIINDIKSNNIEQAIFILKDSKIDKKSNNIINEANNIIDNYIRQVQVGEFPETKNKKKWFNWITKH